MSWRDWITRQMAEWQAALAGKAASAQQSERVGGRSLEEWETGWRRIGLLTSAHVTAPEDTSGLFRLRLGGEVVYLGRSDTSNTDCLRRSLRALTLGEGRIASAFAARLQEQAHELVVEILLTGNKDLARRLEPLLLGQARPAWNHSEPQSQAFRGRPPRALAAGESRSA